MENCIQERLRSMADAGYAAFSKKLTPTAYPIWGVRIPEIRKMAKHLTGSERESVLGWTEFESFEALMLHGFTLAAVDDAHRVIGGLKALVPKIDNWAHIDCITTSIKTVHKNRALFWAEFEPYKTAAGEFEKRFLAVLAMDHYLTDEYVERVLALYPQITQGQYYTDMALAWGLSVLLVKYYERTLPQFLQKRVYSPFVHNKALQKARESRRIGDETKAFLQSLKI